MEAGRRVVVVGAGVGGLTAAAVLARAGLDVTVLEAHVYPGGCAGTFYHQGYRFDAGATLAAGFYPGGPMDLVARAAGVASWPAHPTDAAMMVHLPGGASVTRWTDKRRWEEHRAAFGVESESFWRWQESTADALWDLALRMPPWPPRSMDEALRLAGAGAAWLGRDLRRLNPSLAADAFRPVAAHLNGSAERLRLFVDGQLLIAAQTTSHHANALYGASALDLPRRGVVDLQGGLGAIAMTLAQAIRDSGGQVHYRQEVTHIRRNADFAWAVETKRHDTFPADLVICNLPPWNISRLMEDVPYRLKNTPPRPQDGWGAFVLYVGMDGAALPEDFPLLALPHLRDATDLILPGTPVTFEHFTRRDHGWVGGLPQTNLFRAWAPQLAPDVWMVGDSIFPGQSTAAVALGGLRVAIAILHESLPVHHDAKAQKSFQASLRPHTLESTREFS